MVRMVRIITETQIIAKLSLGAFNRHLSIRELAGA